MTLRPCDCPECKWRRSGSNAPFIPFGIELIEIANAHDGFDTVIQPGTFRSIAALYDTRAPHDEP